MNWRQGFIAVDWGTTNRRAYLVGPEGQRLDEMEDGCGVMAIERGGFPAAVETIRQGLGDRPLLLAGMAGSTRGWIDAPYLPCPAGLSELAAGLVWAEPDRAAIVPGLSYVDEDHADVMRGEEVQLLGAVAAGTIPPNCTVCHPGTHNKWVSVANGRIVGFRTVMTGELFNLLRKGSILSDHLQGDVGPGEAFQAGIRRGLGGGLLTAELFSVRARSLLGKLAPQDSAAFASGLLIGADVGAGLAASDAGEVYVMGSPKLTELYAAAIREGGGEPIEIDGDESFVAGAVRIAELME